MTKPKAGWTRYVWDKKKEELVEEKDHPCLFSYWGEFGTQDRPKEMYKSLTVFEKECPIYSFPRGPNPFWEYRNMKDFPPPINWDQPPFQTSDRMSIHESEFAFFNFEGIQNELGNRDICCMNCHWHGKIKDLIIEAIDMRDCPACGYAVVAVPYKIGVDKPSAP